MKNMSGKSCRENQNNHFMFGNPPPWKSCRLWDNVEKYGTASQVTDNMTKCRVGKMRFACQITKARTHTHTRTHNIEYLLLHNW